MRGERFEKLIGEKLLEKILDLEPGEALRLSYDPVDLVSAKSVLYYALQKAGRSSDYSLRKDEKGSSLLVKRKGGRAPLAVQVEKLSAKDLAIADSSSVIEPSYVRVLRQKVLGLESKEEAVEFVKNVQGVPLGAAIKLVYDELGIELTIEDIL